MFKILYIIFLASIMFNFKSHAAAFNSQDAEAPPLTSPFAAEEVNLEEEEIDLPKFLACTPEEHNIVLNEIAFPRGEYNSSFFDSHLFRTLQKELDDLLKCPESIPLLPKLFWGLDKFFRHLTWIDHTRESKFWDEAYYYWINGNTLEALNQGLRLCPTSYISHPYYPASPSHWVHSFVFVPAIPIVPSPASTEAEAAPAPMDGKAVTVSEVFSTAPLGPSGT